MVLCDRADMISHDQDESSRYTDSIRVPPARTSWAQLKKMNAFLRRLLDGAGIAALVLYPMYQTASLRPWSLRMHSPLPLTDFALALVTNLLLVTLFGAILWTWIGPTRVGEWVRICLPALYAAGVLEGIYLYQTDSPDYRYFLRILVVTLLLVLALRLFWPTAHHWVQEIRRAVGVGLAVFFVFVLVQLVRLAFWHPPQTIVANAAAADARSSASRPRVIWILMDELSYNQVFGERAAGLDLPNFDALRQVSTLYTDVAPVTELTETAVPSLLEGRPFTQVFDTDDNHVLLAAEGEPFSPFVASATPFAEAKRVGMTTGVVGWYNPYCSMLAPYVDHCYWTYQTLQPVVFLVGDGFWRNIEDAWMRYAIVLFPRLGERALDDQRKVYEDLTGRAKGALEDNQLDFVFLHLPLPHPPGFYDRKKAKFDASGHASYLDNLALADRTLGEFLPILRASSRWDQTSIVICGDHSWRTFLWIHSGHWTEEDAAASHGGHFDPRPMLMVHQAGQTTAAAIDHPVSLLKAHEILGNLIRGQQAGAQ